MHHDRETHNVLFICTGNSARSILSEGLMNHLGKGGFAPARPEAARQGCEKQQAIHDATIPLKRRIESFLSLPLPKLDAIALWKAVRDIGEQ